MTTEASERWQQQGDSRLSDDKSGAFAPTEDDPRARAPRRPAWRRSARHWIASALTLALFALSTVVYWTTSADKYGQLYLVLLFAVPVVQTAFAAGYRRSTLTSCLVMCLIAQLALWLMYALFLSKCSPAALHALSIASLMGSVAVIGYVLYFTNLLLSRSDGGVESPDIAVRQAARHPVITITSFLSIFMYVTFLLSFALAFHDQALARNQHAGRALVTDTLSADALAARKALGSQAIQRSPTRRVYFRVKETDVEEDQGLLQTEDKFLDRDNQRKKSNARQLNDLLADLAKYGQLKRLHVVAIGHADRRKPGEGSSEYDTNGAIADARALRTVAWIQQRLVGERPYNIEYSHWGAGESEKFLEEMPELDKKFGFALCTEITIHVIPNNYSEIVLSAAMDTHSLELLDYVYFMIYTITTTGYGDIKPASPAAKFIASMANWYELFFIVVFFNVLLSIRRTPVAASRARPPSEVKPAGGSAPDSAGSGSPPAAS